MEQILRVPVVGFGSQTRRVLGFNLEKRMHSPSQMNLLLLILCPTASSGILPESKAGMLYKHKS